MIKTLTKEQREYMVERIQTYFELERDEEIGTIASEQLLQFMIQELGPFMYNKGINDARQMVEQKVVNLDEDLLSLERPSGHSSR
ncbi:DUF2164 domain-containing protein [Halobacillus sp. A1]|uniref:DUF2164 domain-containing protein n=1 Tax=Halobacillus sp. A1 TaxID=2880262 RepID=UPI0020A64385|nr:DUF2164 domain-containing protein [Halobacillus sp. A1]MCP3029765.1 DUF2164 domain-containing protein [Halobacillus sp. A1]